MSISKFRLQIEYVLATNCSARIKDFLCALLEPECSPPPQAQKMPCYNLCKAVLEGCEIHLPHVLAPVFNCRQYSSANCVSARAPCSAREMACGDGSCIPGGWICDGTRDCPAGEDEAPCSECDRNEFRCQSGPCISWRWVGDGYADCPDGDDEAEPGATPARPVRPVKIPTHQRSYNKDRDSGKQLLKSSNSSNALKRNFTRGSSLTRSSSYSPPKLQDHKTKKQEVDEKAPKKKIDKHESEKKRKAKNQLRAHSNPGRAPLRKSGRRTTDVKERERTKLGRTNKKLDLVKLMVEKAMQLHDDEYQDLIDNTIFENQETSTHNIDT